MSKSRSGISANPGWRHRLGKVFEDPDRGILKLIRDAHSREALRACVLVV